MPSAGEDVGGAFTYQGYLELDGQPANGVFYFRFSMYDTEDVWLGTWWAPAGPVTVTNGVFSCEVLMGGTPEVANQFWHDFGRAAKTMKIEVGEVEGVYTALSPRVPVHATPHALYAKQAGELAFPYADSYDQHLGNPETMFSLTNIHGGITAEFVNETESDEPIVYIRGDDVFSPTFARQSGALLVDSRSDEVAIRGEGTRYSVVGNFSEPSTLPGISAAILGSVGAGSSPDVVAVWGFNSPAGTSARLGTADYAGDFSGDVVVRDNLHVEGDAVRDFTPTRTSPIGPLAYGFVTSTGFMNSSTGNLSAVWDAAQEHYRLSIDGETLVLGQHTVIVTVIDSSEPRLATTNVLGGELIVTIWDLNSNFVRRQDNFQIVVYDANPNAALLRNAVPPGVDPDKYGEATGVMPVTPIVDDTRRPARHEARGPVLD